MEQHPERSANELTNSPNGQRRAKFPGTAIGQLPARDSGNRLALAQSQAERETDRIAFKMSWHMASQCLLLVGFSLLTATSEGRQVFLPWLLPAVAVMLSLINLISVAASHLRIRELTGSMADAESSPARPKGKTALPLHFQLAPAYLVPTSLLLAWVALWDIQQSPNSADQAAPPRVEASHGGATRQSRKQETGNNVPRPQVQEPLGPAQPNASPKDPPAVYVIVQNGGPGQPGAEANTVVDVPQTDSLPNKREAAAARQTIVINPKPEEEEVAVSGASRAPGPIGPAGVPSPLQEEIPFARMWIHGENPRYLELRRVNPDAPAMIQGWELKEDVGR